MSMTSLATRPTPLPALTWWQDPKQIALVKKTAFRDCNDIEFDEAVAVARELNLNPLRKQIYAFVFNKDDHTRRSMVLVISIDGARSIAARHGNYRPDNAETVWVYDEREKNEATNPLGLVSATASAFMFSHGEWHKVVGVAHWAEFAPIVIAGGSDDYEWKETDQVYPEGHRKAGQKKYRKVLKSGAQAVEQIDPKKDGWRKMPRLMLAKCAEMAMLRKGWPEDLSRVYADEETHRAQVLNDVEYADLTPSQMASRSESNDRLERLGGPAIMATFDDAGTLERVALGQFADRVIAHIKGKTPDQVKLFADRNRVALQEFWAHNKTDALELKKRLEAAERSGGSAADVSPIKAELLKGIGDLFDMHGCFEWKAINRKRIDALPQSERDEVEAALTKKQQDLNAA